MRHNGIKFTRVENQPSVNRGMQEGQVNQTGPKNYFKAC